MNCELPDVQAGLEKAEESEIKLPTFAGSWKKQKSSRETSTSALLTMLKLLTVWISQTLLRNLYAGQKATVRTAHGKADWLQIGKGIHQGCILSRAYLTYMLRTS